MIARIWKGAVRTSSTATPTPTTSTTPASPATPPTPGNRGVWMLRRDVAREDRVRDVHPVGVARRSQGVRRRRLRARRLLPRGRPLSLSSPTISGRATTRSSAPHPSPADEHAWRSLAGDVPASGSAQVDELAMASTSGSGTRRCRKRLDVEVLVALLRPAAARGVQAPRRNRYRCALAQGLRRAVCLDRNRVARVQRHRGLRARRWRR